MIPIKQLNLAAGEAVQTLAVDFDGTLCESKFPEIGEPKEVVIEYVKQAAAAGMKIILHTCRENGTKRKLLDEAVAWCEQQGLVFDAINENPFLDFDYGYSYTEQRKMHADAYLDDKALNVADIEETVRHMVQSAIEGRQKL